MLIYGFQASLYNCCNKHVKLLVNKTLSVEHYGCVCGVLLYILVIIKIDKLLHMSSICDISQTFWCIIQLTTRPHAPIDIQEPLDNTRKLNCGNEVIILASLCLYTICHNNKGIAAMFSFGKYHIHGINFRVNFSFHLCLPDMYPWTKQMTFNDNSLCRNIKLSVKGRLMFLLNDIM